MSRSPRVRRAAAGDEAIVRSLRLQALADAPDAFDSAVERERGRTAAEWRAWIASGATFILEAPDGPKGIAVGEPHWTDRAAIFLVSVWVHPDARGTGSAEALVRAVLDWAAARGATDAWLHVGRHNERARRFYEKIGFRATGLETARGPAGIVEVEMRRGLGSCPAGLSSAPARSARPP
jgi:ribosomal protein S18 acetylase RimI-like enzyme